MLSKLKHTLSSRVKRIVLLAVMSSLFLVSLAVYLFLNFYKPAFEIPDFPAIEVGNIPSLNSNDRLRQTVNNGNIKSDFYNILVVGADDSNGNTDTIMVVSLDTKNKTVSMLQIPRDTYTEHASWIKKINSALPYGRAAARTEGKSDNEVFDAGIDYLKSSLWKTFGIAIHCYVYMDLAGFREIVDIVGGVTVDVPFRMKYDDLTPGEVLHIDLMPGVQLLNGDKAEQFMRFRQNNDGTGYRDGDIGRLRAQQQFLASLIKKCMRFNLSQMRQFINTGHKYVRTDLTTLQLAFFAKEFLAIDMSDITIYTAPGEAQSRSVYTPGESKNKNYSYYLIYKEEMLEIVNNHFNAYTQNLTLDNLDLIEFNRVVSGTVNISGNTVDGFENYD